MIYSRALRFNRIEFTLVVGIAFGLLIHLSFTSLFGHQGGLLANVHLAAAMTSLAEGCVVPLTRRSDAPPTQVAGAMYTDDLLVTSMQYEDGAIVVPDGAGWGIDVDPEKLVRYTTSKELVR